jgi:hypothetical protein
VARTARELPEVTFMHRILDRLSYANVLATIALFIALGGGAIAAIHHKRATPIRWAVVNADGSLVRGQGATSAKQLFAGGGVEGSYQVSFNRDVKDCALDATIGRVNAANRDPDPGEIGVAYRNGNRKAVYVKTRASTGSEADRSFHLSVIC